MSNVELFHYLLLLICGAGALTWLAERIAIPPAVVLLFGGGMRGVVSLAAALALPDTFPGRDLIVFSTFLLIIATLVVQGASLAMLIRLLKLRPVARHTMSEHETRARTFSASLAALDEIGKRTEAIAPAMLERLRAEYRIRVAANEKAHASGAEHVEQRARFLRVELELVGVSRQTLLGLHRRQGRRRGAASHRVGTRSGRAAAVAFAGAVRRESTRARCAKCRRARRLHNALRLIRTIRTIRTIRAIHTTTTLSWFAPPRSP